MTYRSPIDLSAKPIGNVGPTPDLDPFGGLDFKPKETPPDAPQELDPFQYGGFGGDRTEQCSRCGKPLPSRGMCEDCWRSATGAVTIETHVDCLGRHFQLLVRTADDTAIAIYDGNALTTPGHIDPPWPEAVMRKVHDLLSEARRAYEAEEAQKARARKAIRRGLCPVGTPGCTCYSGFAPCGPRSRRVE